VSGTVSEVLASFSHFVDEFLVVVRRGRFAQAVPGALRSGSAMHFLQQTGRNGEATAI
jgi:hypothetical protein